MSGYEIEDQGSLISEYGARALFEQHGNDALNAPTNTIYRFPDGYNPTLARLLVFKNGLLQDVTAGDYTETDSRTVTMDAALVDIDMLLGLEIFRDIGYGGLKCADRPPIGAVPGPYTVTQTFADKQELLVFLNGLLLTEGALKDYIAAIPNQFTLNVIPIGPVLVALVLSLGDQGLHFREDFANQGPFPGNVVTVNTLDNDLDTILVFLNGQLQSINYDYIITGPNTVRFTKTVLGANHDVSVIAVAASHPAKWRS